MDTKKSILITGAAGFIGFHLSKRLCKEGFNIVGIDNLNDYYDINLKKARLNQLTDYSNFSFQKMDIVDLVSLTKLFENNKFEMVLHLAAQAGVRYSIENPLVYANSNLVGFTNILEACRHNQIQQLIYASSSSVYGGNTKLPFSESDNVDHPVSFYAATKKANELMAHTYSHLYNLPTTGLRFFTVYGPWGRPDMALFKFTEMMLNNETIPVFNYGNHTRSFTYIDDIIEGISRLLDKPNQKDETPYQILNIGGNKSVGLMDYIKEIEKAIGVKAKIELLPKQPGDVEDTIADTNSLEQLVEFSPQVGIGEGIPKFVEWYKNYYNK
ncbi:MAG: GDP-mannose 4,6-dehydratase [Candidatus Marinimicrobia bacterium]|nr:GDP-mannose 4,6-dehydratase [Candidatus Neomarinimicrobiota bacterium]MBL7109669.1 GDP-mannose 4,6-dehydratase [Candidatus Neomarinimicrobiota bacterium]